MRAGIFHIFTEDMRGGIPWDYRSVVLSFLKDEDKLHDMGTGGREFLLTLEHPYVLTYVTEAYPPNVELCRKRLEPLGITVKQVYEDDMLPFENEFFAVVINRHEYFGESEMDTEDKGFSLDGVKGYSINVINLIFPKVCALL